MQQLLLNRLTQWLQSKALGSCIVAVGFWSAVDLLQTQHHNQCHLSGSNLTVKVLSCKHAFGCVYAPGINALY